MEDELSKALMAMAQKAETAVNPAGADFFASAALKLAQAYAAIYYVTRT